MAAIIDLTLVPYGNTAYSNGVFTCQHGAGECSSDVLESCTMYELNGANTDGMFAKSMEAWPFILCMELAEGDPTQGESCFGSSMNSTSISWSQVNACATNDADLVQTAAMKATPSHDYVPWVVVDGTTLEHSGLLQQAICKAYTGTPPASCHSSMVFADAKRSMN